MYAQAFVDSADFGATKLPQRCRVTRAPYAAADTKSAAVDLLMTRLQLLSLIEVLPSSYRAHVHESHEVLKNKDWYALGLNNHAENFCC
jgi:hypothetical protein